MYISYVPHYKPRLVYFLPHVYNQDWLILETIYVVNKEILQKYLRFIIKSGFKSRAVSNQERVIMEHVWYMNFKVLMVREGPILILFDMT